MKRFNIIALSLLTAAAGLTSCELNKDLFGSDSNKQDSGALEVSVSVKQPGATRASGTTDTSLYPVKIEGTSTNLDYASVSAMPASITLPVGDYTVSSHTPGSLDKKMDTPYYAGSALMTITKDITTTTTVTCKMKNSRVKLNYGTDFLSNFQSWTITVDDGSATALSYDSSDKSPKEIYWTFEENTVTSLTINVRAKTTAGNTVSESRSFKKSNATEKYDDVTDYFAGGDAIVINMGTVASSTGTITGITINTNITFENHDEIVEIPVDDGTTPVDPGDPDDNTPTITLPADFSYKAGDASSRPSSANAVFNTPAGLKSAVVVISTTSSDFRTTLAEVNMGGNLLTGVELVGNSSFDDLFSSVGLEDKAPVAGATQYTFPVGAFFMFLDMYPGEHKFDITVTDNNNATVNGSLTITVTE